MDSTNYQPNRQEVLLTTIHHQNSVVEVYFNEKFQLVSEIIHLSNHRVKLYQYDVAQYKKTVQSTCFV